MISYKIIISLVAVVLTFVGYVPYVRDVLKKKTTPHSFTWFIWGLVGFIGYGLQVFGGAGVGSWALLVACCVCFFIFILSLRIGDKDITLSDIIFFLLALVSLFLWLVVKQPVWSAILAVTVEILGFIPTIRKSWNNPYSETLFTYEVCFFRHGLSIFALQQFNILTLLYPIVWSLANLVFAIILIIRRRVFDKKSVQDTLSEEHIREHCPFCDKGALALTYLLEETTHFRIVSDYNPLTDAHILIIPKDHVSSVGEYSDELFAEFSPIYEKVSKFVLSKYGSVSSFEHGKIGQTVFHSHMHVLSFTGDPLVIIPEGEKYLKKITGIKALRGKTEYLFFSVGNKNWLVDTALGEPRFFRNRFAKALGIPERANWKNTQNDPVLRQEFDKKNKRCKELWQSA